MFEFILNWFKPEQIIKEKSPKLNVKNKPITKNFRKKRDMTKITKQMYDFIIDSYSTFERDNEDELLRYINLCLNTNFSRSKIQQVWLGKLNREDLPDGKEIRPF